MTRAEWGKHGVAPADRAVFLDVTGDRWRTVKRYALLAVLGAFAAAAWFVPKALIPDPGTDPRVRGGDTALLDSLPKRLPVLLHDGGNDHAATLVLVERLLREAKAKGYTFVTMASLHPDGRRSYGRVPVSLTDEVTRWAFWTGHTLPGLLVRALFVLGAGTMIVVSVATLILALVERRRRRRKAWPAGPLPPVSVLVAAYNEAAVIGKLLDSLRRNHYPDLEVLIVDDGSTDGTAAAVRALGWDRVRLIRQPNSGKATALNRALAEARAEIVLTFDADSVLRPGTVGALARHFADARVGGVAGQVKVGNRRGC